MRAFLDTYLPPRQGEIVLADGTVLGEVHDGIEHFTIGQRRGLGVAWREPLHVIRLDAAMNRVVVAPRADAGRSSCEVGSSELGLVDPPAHAVDVEVQVRYRSQPVGARMTPQTAQDDDNQRGRPYRCRLDFAEEQFSITPGQAAVFIEVTSFSRRPDQPIRQTVTSRRTLKTGSHGGDRRQTWPHPGSARHPSPPGGCFRTNLGGTGIRSVPQERATPADQRDQERSH